MLVLLRQGRLSKWFSGIGQEAISVGVVAATHPNDWLLPLHRNLGVFTGRGVPLDRLFRQLLGRADGFTAGRDRSFHFGTLEHRIVGMISHLGAMLPVADGLALAAQLRDERRVAVAFIGDGATSEGDVHEAMNLAAVWQLPVVFVVENNQFGLSTPTTEQYACADLADRAEGYGMPGALVDGNDVLAVRDAAGEATDRARRGSGPSLLECKTFRMRGHEEASSTEYVPAELVAAWADQDPIVRLERELDAHGGHGAPERDAIRRELQAHIDTLVADALAAPEPTSTTDDEVADVWAAPSPLRHTEPDIAHSAETMAAETMATETMTTEVRYLDAISDALRTAMRADDRVLLLGQDIAEYGGVFKVTAGFVEEFGKARVRNTPMSESATIGASLGLALDGFRPVVELQFGDFVTCGFNQIVNNLATTHYRWDASVPVVLRLPVGGGLGAGPFHSQSPEAWFCHVPGLKVVAPATPADAKGLLLSALEDGNPVLYLEHKFLYRNAVGDVPPGWHGEPIGTARVARPGRDATIITWSVGVSWALDAAAMVESEGASVEVVDLRSLRPWDVELVLESARRTGRVLVLHEAPLTGGFGGEVAATIAERAFADLDAPVTRVGGLDAPVPLAKQLEQAASARAGLPDALRALLAY